MSFLANAYKVMIASPSDVANEREIIRQIVHLWNALNSFEKKIVLLPVGWETHSAPEMGGHPQEIINKRILKDCDLLVGTFWTRIGTQTQNSASGTIEEIEEHIKQGKPAMIYFSSIPVQPDSVDSEQYGKLQEFKKDCRKKGLIEEYNSLSDFRDKFLRQLSTRIIQDDYFKKESTYEVTSVNKDDPLKRLTLSEESKTLLINASESSNGVIMSLLVSSGHIIQTKGKQFIEMGNPRSEALWKNALNELESLELINAENYKHEVFRITHKGYEVSELLKTSM